MFHYCDFEFKKAAINKKSADGHKVYSAVASTASIDRHKEVLIPKGCIPSRFLTNPVMLNIHDSRQYPVGKVLEVRINEDSVQFDFEFADTENGKELEKLYTTGMMNAFSVGFIPKTYIDCYDLRDNEGNWKVSSIEFELPDGTKSSFDLTRYKTSELYGIIPKWELLEISPVPIPANPDALLLRAKNEAIRKYEDQGHSKAAVSFVERQLSDNLAKLTLQLNSFIKTLDESTEISNVVPYLKNSVVDSDWDVHEAKTSLVLWSSSDKSGDKETMDWGQYAKGFGWVDLNKADQLSSYKYCHHKAEAEDLVVVWKGLTEAMSLLLADIAADGAKDVHAHLCQHYADFGKTAPEFKEYTAEELALIKAGSEVAETQPDPKTNKTDDLSSVEKSLNAVTLGMTDVKDHVIELEETVRLRFNILGRMLDELQKTVNSKSEAKSEVEDTPSEDVEADAASKLLTEKLSSLSSLFSDMNHS